LVARFLVTTAMEDTWPVDNSPVLFLGEWCRLFSKKSSWENLDFVVVPYHWDDRQKLHKDYLYLQSLYEVLLKQLASQLNELHKVDYSLRYWRILIGPWLGYFIQMLFDRSVMLQQVLYKFDISDVLVIGRSEGELVPNDMAEFSSLFTSDNWNEFIYGQILGWMGVPFDKVDIQNHISEVPNKANIFTPSRRLKKFFEGVSSWVFRAFCRNNEYFFISSYLGIWNEVLIQIKLRQLPKLWRSFVVPHNTFDSAQRQCLTLRTDNIDKFSKLASALIPLNIPKAYVEGYNELVYLTESLPWPKNPKAIFTANSYSDDDVFKAWAARKTESGVPLIIGQHGGNYGMAAWSFTEDHQIEIADHFISWGWKKSGYKNILPVGNFKDFDKKKLSSRKDGIALMVEMSIPRQSYHMYSLPVASEQWLEYFEDQCRFVGSLPECLHDQLLVRLYSSDYGVSQRQRWLDQFPNINLDEGVKPIAELLDNTRIYISTYNATTYLESLSRNFPTIIFWNPKHWELRDTALPYFEKLKSVGIFHDTPQSAAHQMAAVWNDVSSWWGSAEVQSVRIEFCDCYSHVAAKPLNSMAHLFRQIAADPDD
jgi:putative transferase (TIGR04331 family)